MGLKLFGLVSPRGDFNLKTTLHRSTEGQRDLIVNGWQRYIARYHVKEDGRIVSRRRYISR